MEQEREDVECVVVEPVTAKPAVERKKKKRERKSASEVFILGGAFGSTNFASAVRQRGKIISSA